MKRILWNIQSLAATLTLSFFGSDGRGFQVVGVLVARTPYESAD